MLTATSYSKMTGTLCLFLTVFLFNSVNADDMQGALPSPPIPIDNSALKAETEKLFGVKHIELQRPDIIERTDGTFATLIQVEQDQLLLVLEPYSPRAKDFRIIQVTEGHTVEHLKEIPPPKTYRGHVQGIPDSRVAASIDGTNIRAMIDVPGQTTWAIEPIGSRFDRAQDKDHALYSVDNLEPFGQCGVVHESSGSPETGNSPNTEDVAGSRLEKALDAELDSTSRQHDDAFDMPYTARIAIEADEPYFQHHDESTEDVLDEIDDIFNMVDFIYERDTLIDHTISFLVILGSGDPYTTTDPDDLLDQVREFWNTHRTDVDRDIAHLFTGRELDGDIIGKAFLGTVCDSVEDGRGYAINQVTFETPIPLKAGLVAHELGHNYDARHCDEWPNESSPCHIMCSSINQCDGLGEPEFGFGSASTICDFADGETCTGTGIRWVDLGNGATFPNGSFSRPFGELSEAVDDAPTGGTIIIKSSTSGETLAIEKQLDIHTWWGGSRIGEP